jgi:hypothetical protein
MNTTLARVALLCDEIRADLEQDVRDHEGMPLNGRVVAEYFGTIAGTIAGLAGVVKALAEHLDK